jgi:D-sedoheptulose 7-phosphate isomerase
VLIAISASGNSPNILAGLKTATGKGIRTIGLLGFDGGAAIDLVDVAIHIPSRDYGVVEAAHSAITHAITLAMHKALSGRIESPPLAAHPIPRRLPSTMAHSC